MRFLWLSAIIVSTIFLSGRLYADDFLEAPRVYLAQGLTAACGPGVAPYGDAGLQGAAAKPLSAVTGQSFPVDSKGAFKAAVREAGPGDEIVVKDGTYSDWGSIILQSSGTAEAPLILRAETPLGVTFTGDSTFYLKGNHLEVSGFVIKDTKSWGMVGNPGRHHVRITGNRFESVGVGDEEEVLRIFADTHDFEIDNNEFTNVQHQGINLYGDTTEPQHHKVHHNWFHDVPKLRGNGHEAITSIGGQKYVDEANVENVIAHNFFERWSGESELISMKTSGYLVRDNVVVDSDSALTIRNAKRVVMADNILVDSRGIGVNGSGHEITGNKCYGRGGCLALFGVSDIDVKGAGRPVAKDNIIADNIFTSVDEEPIMIVYRDGSVVDPVADNVLKHNIIFTEAKKWLKVTGNPSSVFLDRNQMTDNSIASGAGPLTLPAGNSNQAPDAALASPQAVAIPACGEKG